MVMFMYNDLEIYMYYESTIMQVGTNANSIWLYNKWKTVVFMAVIPPPSVKHEVSA